MMSTNRPSSGNEPWLPTEDEPSSRTEALRNSSCASVSAPSPGQRQQASEGPCEPAGARNASSDTLREIAAEIERFLGTWMQRFDHLLQQCREQVESEDAARQRLAEFDQQCREWEAQRERDAQELHEKAEQLTEAWLRLESEQRAVMQAQSSLKYRDRDVPNTSATLSQQGNQPQPGNRRCDNHIPAANASTISSEISQQAAVQQFELLRHQIGNHTPTV